MTTRLSAQARNTVEARGMSDKMVLALAGAYIKDGERNTFQVDNVIFTTIKEAAKKFIVRIVR